SVALRARTSVGRHRRAVDRSGVRLPDLQYAVPRARPVAGAGFRVVAVRRIALRFCGARAPAASYRPRYANLVVAVAGAGRPIAVPRSPLVRAGEIAAAARYPPAHRAGTRDGRGAAVRGAAARHAPATEGPAGCGPAPGAGCAEDAGTPRGAERRAWRDEGRGTREGRGRGRGRQRDRRQTRSHRDGPRERE